MKLAIKNMVCPRCITSVSNILADMKIAPTNVELGFAETDRMLATAEIEELNSQLKDNGFELIFDRETELVNVVKSVLIKYIAHIEQSDNPEKLSVFAARKTNYNYSYLSKVFSDQTNATIESRLIEMKIERVKELLSFRKWTLSEIAWMLKYSSVQYLSNQFKRTTGITVTEYLAGKEFSRRTLDQL